MSVRRQIEAPQSRYTVNIGKQARVTADAAEIVPRIAIVGFPGHRHAVRAESVKAYPPPPAHIPFDAVSIAGDCQRPPRQGILWTAFWQISQDLYP